MSRLLAKQEHRLDVAIDGKLAAIALVTERLRESVPATLVELQRLGLPVVVLSGDNSERLAALELPGPEGNLFPEDKKRRIEEMKQAGGRPLMIGDGINDAAALAVAHAGIAISSGSELAGSAASATLYHGDLRVIPWAIELSREALRSIRRNLLRAACYNLIGITLAACGILHPIVAALLMVVSSVLVAWSSVRVGVEADRHRCGDQTPEPLSGDSSVTALPWFRGAIHAVALASQGIVFSLLLALSRDDTAIVVSAFLLLAMVTSLLWIRWRQIPHGIDMAFSMLTLGNLGMLIGWWTDNGFTPLHDGGCCACIDAMRQGLFRPWMWVGMLIFANLAMGLLPRRPHRGSTRAMFTGGNLGMVMGMLAGGYVAALVPTEKVAWAAVISFAGMTIGMIAGMQIGTVLARTAIPVLLRLRNLPGWLLGNSSQKPVLHDLTESARSRAT
ncbi:MAG: HAD-IC family P-type ATPase [Planctomycetes bacterium]|nr:HAD-IC family P-type ATPase [Planctomycetota bacterium]